MPIIHIASHPMKQISIQESQKVFEPLMNAHIPIGTACRGDQICGKCVFQAEPKEHISPEDDSERDCKSRNSVPSGFRLACFATIFG